MEFRDSPQFFRCISECCRNGVPLHGVGYPDTELKAGNQELFCRLNFPRFKLVMDKPQYRLWEFYDSQKESKGLSNSEIARQRNLDQ